MTLSDGSLAVARDLMTRLDNVDDGDDDDDDCDDDRGPRPDDNI